MTEFDARGAAYVPARLRRHPLLLPCGHGPGRGVDDRGTAGRDGFDAPSPLISRRGINDQHAWSLKPKRSHIQGASSFLLSRGDQRRPRAGPAGARGAPLRDPRRFQVLRPLDGDLGGFGRGAVRLRPAVAQARRCRRALGLDRGPRGLRAGGEVCAADRCRAQRPGADRRSCPTPRWPRRSSRSRSSPSAAVGWALVYLASAVARGYGHAGLSGWIGGPVAILFATAAVPLAHAASGSWFVLGVASALALALSALLALGLLRRAIGWERTRGALLDRPVGPLDRDTWSTGALTAIAEINIVLPIWIAGALGVGADRGGRPVRGAEGRGRVLLAVHRGGHGDHADARRGARPP